MNRKARFWIFLGVYAAILAGGFLLLGLGGLGVTWDIAIAMLLVILTAFVSYALAHPKKKK